MNQWWKFDINYSVLVDFASIMHPSGEVTDWTIILTKMLVGYAAHRSLRYQDLTAREIVDEVKELKSGNSGYAKYIRSALFANKSDSNIYDRYYNKDVISTLQKLLYGEDTADELSLWLVLYLYRVIKRDVGVVECIKDYVVDIVKNYKRSETLYNKFVKQVVIAITMGCEVLDCLENGGKAVHMDYIGIFPLRIKCEVSPKIKSYTVRTLSRVQLSEYAMNKLMEYKGSLPEHTRESITDSELVNMFICSK